MRTTLYLSLAANGCFSSAAGQHALPDVIFADLRQLATRTGILVIGRKTHEQLLKTIGDQAFVGVQLVVVARFRPEDDSVPSVASPREAIDFLAQRGFASALIAGGAQADRSSLAEGLIDELVLNIEPLILDGASAPTLLH